MGAGGAPVSGNVLVQQGGIVSVYKYADTEYWVYGDSQAFSTAVGSPNILIQNATLTIVAGSPRVATAIASADATTYRSVEYIVQATRGNNYHATKLLAIHDGTNADYTEYGTITLPSFFGSPTQGSPAVSGEQATFTVGISGGNLELYATPRNGTGTIAFKVVSNLITL